ncbi:MAG TPA: aconitate hydratase AcnA [Thermoplasmata archaeon]|nr:aconitate hydratase AcnA [Thermoplasmata archaeon]
MTKAADPWGVTEAFELGRESSVLYALDKIPGVDAEKLARRPKTIRVLLENLLRHSDGSAEDGNVLRALAHGDRGGPTSEIPFRPERILLQDFTGVPVLVDLTGLRSAALRNRVDPGRVNPNVPVDLVVDHSVQVDSYGKPGSLAVNLDHEYQRNGERYILLRWARTAFRGFRVVPPGNGIVHQVNLEYIASVVTRRERNGVHEVFPDTVIGTDSHTTMVNGLGVLGWGVGGIEAEAAMLGEPYFLSPPIVVGVRLSGELPSGATATDLVLTVARKLRAHGVVDKFVEFYGPGLRHLTVPDRATIANMCPEYGATSALFPIDEATLSYLRGTGRPASLVARVEAYGRRQGLWNDPDTSDLDFDERLELDLRSIVPTVSGPRNPEESVALSQAPASFRTGLASYRSAHPASVEPTEVSPADDPLQAGPSAGGPSTAPPNGRVHDGTIVVAAITSCTNTSNPSVMVGAGLIAQKAHAKGLHPPSYVKTSLAPGSKVVTDYLDRAGLTPALNALGFNLVGYGCTTCIGNTGPLPPAVETAVREGDLYVAAVLSGNRNFEARIHNLVRANYLMSPMLVVAYALAGRMDIDLTTEPLGKDREGHPVFLRDLWPGPDEIRALVEKSLNASLYEEEYSKITVGDPHWEALPNIEGAVYPWDAASTYLRDPPYFDLAPPLLPEGHRLLDGARVLAVLGDRVSTDHISPAGEIPADGPAGRYLQDHGVSPAEFNTFGTRRGNHEVMVRGTFANVRIQNALAAPKEGGWTRHLPSGDLLSIYEAAERYRREKVPLVVLAGASYGQGSSRDWAAKGPRLLGVRAVIAQSYERIHRSNLVGMGVLPLEFLPGQGVQSLQLTGHERFALRLPEGVAFGPRVEIEAIATDDAGTERRFRVRCRIDSEPEMEYYRSGGILPFVLKRMAGAPAT